MDVLVPVFNDETLLSPERSDVGALSREASNGSDLAPACGPHDTQ